MIAPWLLAVALVLGLIILIPARRLQLAGVSRRAASIYATLLWLGAMLLAIRPVGTRFLIPILLIAYLAPFVAAPDTVRRVLARGRDGMQAGLRPMKDVTPPDANDGPGTTDASPDKADEPRV